MKRFWDKVEKTPDCWVWKSAFAGKYGVFWLNGGNVLAHRLAYELEVGRIMPKMTIDHTCRNTACVRPDHLEQITQAENNRRMAQAVWGEFCRNGHDKSVVGMYIRPDGYGYCRGCRVLHQNKMKERVVVSNV